MPSSIESKDNYILLEDIMEVTKTRLSSAAASDTFFEDILQSLPGMVVVYNINTGEYLYVNDGVKKILGYNPQDFIKKGFSFVSSLVHPDDLPHIIEENQKAL